MKHIFYILILSLFIFNGCDDKQDPTSLLNNQTDSTIFKTPILDTLSNSISTNTSLTKNRVWILTGKVVIESGITLKIEAGTKIIAKENSWLLISSGAKIEAVGTTGEPIIFDRENSTTKWGGITIIGNSNLNSLYEGDSISQTSNTNNSSGVMSYVHINNSGLTISKDKEINGLSLFGVTSNTKINNITINNSLDDGVEIWGGDVNLQNIVIDSVDDDGFDTDLGWSGTVDNLVVKNAKDCALELSGVGIGKYKNVTIKSNSKGLCFSGFDGESVGADIVNMSISNDLLMPSIYLIGNFNDQNSKFENIQLVGVDKNISGTNPTEVNKIKALFDTQSKTITPQINIISDIIVDTTFTKDNLYILQGVINVKSGVTLNIKEGTTITALDSSQLNIENGASLIANGSINQHITFKAPIQNGQTINKWNGIFINSDKNNTSNILNYVDIFDGGLNLYNVYKPTILTNINVSSSSNNCITIDNGDVNLTNINIRNCEKNYLDIQNGYSGIIDTIFLQQYKGDYGVFLSNNAHPIFNNFQIIQNVFETTGSQIYKLIGGIYILDALSGIKLYKGTISDNVVNGIGGIHTDKIITKSNFIFVNFIINGKSGDRQFTGASDTILSDIYVNQ